MQFETENGGPRSGRSRPSTTVKDSSDACRKAHAFPSPAGLVGRRWIRVSFANWTARPGNPAANGRKREHYQAVVGPAPAVHEAKLPAGLRTFAADECRVLAGASSPESYGKHHPTFTQYSCTPKLIERQMIPIGKPLQGEHHVALNWISDRPGFATDRMWGWGRGVGA